jgi:hypothetical protein
MDNAKLSNMLRGIILIDVTLILLFQIYAPQTMDGNYPMNTKQVQNHTSMDCEGIIQPTSPETTITAETTTTTTTTIPFYKPIMEEIASRKYIPGGYDCNDMSMDFCKKVHAEGYECKVCWGKYGTSRHTWSMVYVDGNKIFIELMGGYEISNQEFMENYTLGKCT